MLQVWRLWVASAFRSRRTGLLSFRWPRSLQKLQCQKSSCNENLIPWKTVFDLSQTEGPHGQQYSTPLLNIILFYSTNSQVGLWHLRTNWNGTSQSNSLEKVTELSNARLVINIHILNMLLSLAGGKLNCFELKLKGRFKKKNLSQKYFRVI